MYGGSILAAHAEVVGGHDADDLPLRAVLPLGGPASWWAGSLESGKQETGDSKVARRRDTDRELFSRRTREMPSQLT